MYPLRPPSRIVSNVAGLSLGLVLAVAPGALAGAVYQWTDADGGIHFTDDPSTIPKKFRDTVQQLRPPGEPKEPAGPPSAEPEGGLPAVSQPEATSKREPASEPVPSQAPPSEALDARGHNRDWWRQRVQEWESKKAEAEARLADAQERLGRERFLNATTGNMQRIQEISAEVSMYEEQIKEAENMLTDGLPDEARRAQAPPGWLR
jgi:hypothetical protein